jgi:hypothetical protein
VSAPGYQRCAFSNLTEAIAFSLHRQERAGRSEVKRGAAAVGSA